MKIRSFLLAMMLCALCVTQASALEYDFDAPEDYLFGQPTSDDTIYEWENPNVDRSKNAALIAPGFGTPTSYLPGSGEYLTPNLVPGALSGGLVNQVGSAGANAAGGVAGSSVITDSVSTEWRTGLSCESKNVCVAGTAKKGCLEWAERGSVGTRCICAVSSAAPWSRFPTRS